MIGDPYFVDARLWDLLVTAKEDLFAAENGDELALRRLALMTPYSLDQVKAVVDRLREVRTHFEKPTETEEMKRALADLGKLKRRR